MPGQIQSVGDEYRDSFVRERVADEDRFTDVTEAFRGSRPKRYITLLSLANDQVTHAALTTRTNRVATGIFRLRYDSISALTPISYSAIANRLPQSLRHHFIRNLALDGWIPEATWRATLDIVRQDFLNDLVIQELERQLGNRPLTITPGEFQVLTEERDALSVALQVFNPSRSTLIPSISSLGTVDEPFLVALQSADMPEDSGIAHDTSVFDGWLPAGVPAVGAMTFDRNGERLTVANVNRTPIEHVLGVDLIYFHEKYRSFVFIQYKRMTRDSDSQAYYRPYGKSYSHQYRQMKAWDSKIRAYPTSPDLTSYRLGRDAFFFKIYANPIGALTPDRLLKGMYFPLSYWTALIASPEARGPRGGVVITHDNSGRYFNNTEFTGLVGDGWIGSTPQGEMILANLVAQALEARHSVTLAVAEQAERPNRD